MPCAGGEGAGVGAGVGVGVGVGIGIGIGIGVGVGVGVGLDVGEGTGVIITSVGGAVVGASSPPQLASTIVIGKSRHRWWYRVSFAARAMPDVVGGLISTAAQLWIVNGGRLYSEIMVKEQFAAMVSANLPPSCERGQKANLSAD